MIKGDEISETQPASTTPQPATERPVSPLLRPASRLRIPRHGARHREEPAAETPATPAPEAEATTETPRPARRYRFDRPSTKNGATTPPAQPATPSGSLLSPTQPAASPRQEEPKEKDGTGRANAATRSENGHGNETQTKQPAAEVQPAVQEPASPDVASPAAPVAQPTQPEHGRRRHSQQERQREKEQHAAAASAQAAAEIVVPPTQVVETPQEEIAPEDLPPLEYSELQKASTRRRRRHRSGTGSATAPAPTTNAAAPQALTRPAVAEVPAAQAPAPLAPAPAQDPAARVPNTPAAASNQFTIVSGYTVNQMNQGNELSGPFMGPEPSPARGSLLSRDMRSVRAEVQRAPAYTTRSAENVHSTASINQLANVVAQAIQTQTDRMVAELRRANQAPTNVSVTLPPFPSTERVGVFVDVANLLYSARTLRIAVDFGKLLDFLRGNRRLVRAHAYCPTSPQPGDEQMFLQAVKGLGYRITTKNYKTFSSGAKKADLDLDLCMDVVRLVDGRAVDCIVLVSGDSDFMPMLDYCSEHGVRVEVAAFDEAMSQTLRQSCDLFVNLSMLEEIRV